MIDKLIEWVLQTGFAVYAYCTDFVINVANLTGFVVLRDQCYFVLLSVSFLPDTLWDDLCHPGHSSEETAQIGCRVSKKCGSF